MESSIRVQIGYVTACISPHATALRKAINWSVDPPAMSNKEGRLGSLVSVQLIFFVFFV